MISAQRTLHFLPPLLPYDDVARVKISSEKIGILLSVLVLSLDRGAGL